MPRPAGCVFCREIAVFQIPVNCNFAQFQESSRYRRTFRSLFRDFRSNFHNIARVVLISLTTRAIFCKICASQERRIPSWQISNMKQLRVHLTNMKAN